MDLGKLTAKKVSYHRVEVTFPPSVCDSSGTVEVQQEAFEGPVRMTRTLGSVACGKDFLIDSFKPGEYDVQVWIQRKDGSSVRAFAPVTVQDDDRNPRVTLAPQ
jgi:hypothetical protein